MHAFNVALSLIEMHESYGNEYERFKYENQ